MGNVIHAEPTEVVAVVRFRRGVVGERKRVCHIVPIPDFGPIPEHLVALCGELLVPGDVEVLDRIGGMPCEACLTRSARRACRRLR
ncbi:hypothetical protein FNH05_05370 [Amycolatopsis rhizosphaerae]|uniref:Uncharacterized protein n=1 Tax=Amycolatopsis rhizosphaerae TaxID=2053003 RepID=A0A558DEB4_9PSEU|nr:hypothetical protein [Amycolatopsis rhizosphaerae]TVT59361.1 hypothetical protein FNH05_05370 [Amycolatopsis rhizosphaerae]